MSSIAMKDVHLFERKHVKEQNKYYDPIILLTDPENLCSVSTLSQALFQAFRIHRSTKECSFFLMQLTICHIEQNVKEMELNEAAWATETLEQKATMVGTLIHNKCVIAGRQFSMSPLYFCTSFEQRHWLLCSGLSLQYFFFFFFQGTALGDRAFSICVKQKADLFIVQNNKDNVFWDKGQVDLLDIRFGFPQFRVLQL